VKFLCFVAIASVLAGATAGCGSEELASTARDREITVDGDAGDWKGILRFVEDGNMSYGLTNDAQSMYVVLVVGDREVRRQIIMSGLYLWFDPAGEENKRFGIRFPIGLQDNIADMMPLLREQDPNKLSESFDETVKEMLVIGPQDQSWRRAPVGTVEGIETAAKAEPNMLVLEFKVPVTNDGQYGYGLGAFPGDVIGLGVETPKIDVEDMREQMRAAGGGGRGGTGGGGRGGMGGGRRSGGRRPDMPDPIKVWTKVHLATGAVKS
jgi:uncharacterized membrane protein YgcG